MVLVLLKETPEDVVEGQEIDKFRGIVCVQRLDLRSDLLGDVARLSVVGPHGLKLRHEEFDLRLGLIPRTMGDHRQRVRSALNAQSLQGEGGTLSRKQMGAHARAFDDVGRRMLEHVLAPHGTQGDLLPEPGCTRPRESALVELVAQRQFQVRVSERSFSLALRPSRDIELGNIGEPFRVRYERGFVEKYAHGIEAFKLLAELSKGEQADVRADNRQFRIVVNGGTQGFSQASALGVVEHLHGHRSSPSCRDSH